MSAAASNPSPRSRDNPLDQPNSVTDRRNLLLIRPYPVAEGSAPAIIPCTALFTLGSHTSSCVSAVVSQKEHDGVLQRLNVLVGRQPLEHGRYLLCSPTHTSANERGPRGHGTTRTFVIVCQEVGKKVLQRKDMITGEGGKVQGLMER